MLICCVTNNNAISRYRKRLSRTADDSERNVQIIGLGYELLAVINYWNNVCAGVRVRYSSDKMHLVAGPSGLFHNLLVVPLGHVYLFIY